MDAVFYCKTEKNNDNSKQILYCTHIRTFILLEVNKNIFLFCMLYIVNVNYTVEDLSKEAVGISLGRDQTS